MRVLFVVPYVPSLIRTRSLNLIRHLTARGHQVTVAAVAAGARDEAAVRALETACLAVHVVSLPAWRSMVNCLRALAGRQPLQSVYSWSDRFAALVDGLAEAADVVHVEHLRGVRYGLRVVNRQGRRVPVVWDSVDCISYLFEQSMAGRPDRAGRLLNRLELSRTRECEARAWQRFDRVLITSEIDRGKLLTLRSDPASRAERSRSAPARRVAVVPNGVDTAYFAPADVPRDDRLLVFSGKMSYHANVTAALQLVAEIMPLVWKALPDVRLAIVGKDPPATLVRAAARAADRVTITGTVPDVRPYLRRAAAATIPLVYGAGSQFKVLEAMACATPVVATPQAVSALSARAGSDLIVASGPEAFAGAVVDLLRAPARQRQIGECGRRYVEARHRWSQIAEGLESVYASAIAAAGRAAAARTPALSDEATRGVAV